MSAQIKKVYAELFTLLNDNQDKKVKSLLPQIMELVQSKQMTKTFKVDAEGKVTHVFCYYHKKWEDVSVAEYGSKAKSASSLNSMCKEGVNQWTKQQRDFKKGKEQVLAKVASGELTPDQIHSELVKLEEQSKLVTPRADGHGVEEMFDE